MEFSEEKWESLLKHKRVLFVTTKNVDYIRNVQEIHILKEHSELVWVIGSKSEQYFKRVISVWYKFFTANLKQYDLVFLGFSPQLVYPLFFWKLKHMEVWIDFFISVYDTLICDRKWFKRNGIMASFCKWIDRFTLDRAALVLSDTKVHGDYFAREFHVERKKIRTLYLEVDSEIYYPRKLEKSVEFSGKRVVLYFGSALPLQGIDVILDAAREVCAHPAFHFIIVGPVEKIHEKPLCKNITYYRWLSQEELAEKIAQSDLCLAGHFNDNIDKAKRTIPGKAYIYRAMQKPMILGDNAATREIFDESMEGIHFVKMGDSHALAEKILELL